MTINKQAVIMVILLISAPVSLSCALTIDEAVALALQHNPVLRSQQLSTQLAQEDKTAKKASNYGKLSFVSSFTHYNNPRTLTPMTPSVMQSNPAAVATTEDLCTTGVIYEIELFTGFAQTRAIEVATLQQQLSVATTSLNREQLIYNVKVLFVNILAQQELHQAQQSYVDAIARLHQAVQNEVDLGRKAPVDALKSGAELQRARGTLQHLHSQIEVMQSALAALMGTTTINNTLGKMEKTATCAKELVVIDSEQQLAQLPELQRLRQAQLAVDKQRKQVEQVSSSLYPHVVASAAYGQNYGPNDSSNVNDGDWEHQEVWQAGINLRWDLFDFGGRSANISKAKIQQQQQQYLQQQTQLELQRALQEAINNINTAVADYRSATAELKLSNQSAAIEQIRFDAGAADINDLLYAKSLATQADSRCIAAVYAYTTASFYLDYLLEKGEHK